MIDAKELRINNWVMTTQIFDESEFSNFFQVGQITTPEIRASPIPITEEWLSKFGFKYNGWNWEFNQFKFHAQGKNDKGEFYNTEFYIQSKNEWVLISFTIDSVHQLQNLYFALTGNELTLNK